MGIIRTCKVRRGDIEAGDDAGGQFLQGALVSVCIKTGQAQ